MVVIQYSCFEKITEEVDDDDTLVLGGILYGTYQNYTLNYMLKAALYAYCTH